MSKVTQHFRKYSSSFLCRSPGMCTCTTQTTLNKRWLPTATPLVCPCTPCNSTRGERNGPKRDIFSNAGKLILLLKPAFVQLPKNGHNKTAALKQTYYIILIWSNCIRLLICIASSTLIRVFHTVDFGFLKPLFENIYCIGVRWFKTRDGVR